MSSNLRLDVFVVFWGEGGYLLNDPMRNHRDIKSEGGRQHARGIAAWLTVRLPL